MARIPKGLRWLTGTFGWVSSVFPGFWSAVLTAAVAFGAVALTVGVNVLKNPLVIGGAQLYLVFLWTIIGLTWLYTRQPKKMEQIRYGITFEGIGVAFSPDNEEASLQFSVGLRNFSPVPIRYSIEKFEVFLGTRTLLSRYKKGDLKGILPRGSLKYSSHNAFRKEHVSEFFGNRVAGQLDFSVIYGDADGPFMRSYRISLTPALTFSVKDGKQEVSISYNITEEEDKPMAENQ